MPAPKRRKNATLAALFNLLFCLGGLGYVYLGQARKGLSVMLALVVLHALNGLGGVWGSEWMGRTLLPLAFLLQVLTAADAFLLARRLQAGEELSPWRTLVPALRVGRQKGTPQPTTSTSKG